MSKSIGNVINPGEIVKEYGTDALRYFLLREISSFEDSPFTMERFKDAYNANLANGLGNLVSRVMTMAETNLQSFELVDGTALLKEKFYNGPFNSFKVQEVMEYIWGSIQSLDQEIQTKEPFKLIKTNKEEGIKIIKSLLNKLLSISEMLEPIMPETSEKIQKLIRDNKKPEKPLFLRKD